MHVRSLTAVIFFSLFACSPKKESPSAPEAVASTTDYSPPILAEGNRKNIPSAFRAIDKIFKNEFEKNHFPGLAYGVVVDGELVYSNALGVANVQLMINATPKSLFRIASMSKSFTAMAIMRLRDAGKLSLNDPVSKFIPEMEKIHYLTSDSPPITIENLMTMSAGFPEDNPWGDRQLSDTDEELLEFIRQGITFSNAPGLEFEYSNLGFGMLGRIISKVSGQPYQTYINENIIGPLKMNDTKWEYSVIPKETLALGYRWEDNNWKEEPLLHDGIFGAMGGLICSVEDFSKYMRFHLSAWPPRNEEESSVLKRSSLREMHQLQRLGGLNPQARSNTGELCPTLSGYGYGLGFRKDCKGIVTIRHGGGLPGYGSEWRILPEYGIGIVELGNLTYGGLGNATARAIDTLILLAGLKPRQLPPSAILLQRQKEILALLPGWEENKLNIFAENFFLDRSIESWKKSTPPIMQALGKIIRVNTIIPENQLRGTFVIEGEKKNLEVFFTLTPEHNPLIQELDFQFVEK